MDKNLLEFWGNTLKNMGKTQEQMEAMNDWVNQSIRNSMMGMEYWTNLFKVPYQLNTAPKSAQDYFSYWEKAVKDLSTSMQSFVSFIGLIPKEEHLKVVKKYEDLKKKISDLEETADHLKLLKTGTTADQTGVIDKFQEIIKQQSEQFQALMKSAEQYFNNGSKSNGKPKRTTKKTKQQ